MKKCNKHVKRGLVALVAVPALVLSACGNGSENGQETPIGQPENGYEAVNGEEMENGMPPLQPRVYVNGEYVTAAFTIDNDLETPDMPTHVVLMAVLYALDQAPVSVSGGHVTVEGLNGTITFEINSEDFVVDGETINLAGMTAFELDGTIYVPIRFFRDVFGMNNAYFSGGIVNINNEERME